MAEEASSLSSRVVRVAGLTTALSVIFAAAAQVLTLTPALIRSQWPVEDVRVMAFDSRQRLVLGNRGDVEYYISDIIFHHEHAAVGAALARYGRDMAETSRLERLCKAYFDELSGSTQAQFRDRTRDAAAAEPASVDALCAEHVAKLQERLGQFERQAAVGWVPATKDFSIAETLGRGETKEFSLRSTEWSRCPLFNPQRSGGDAAQRLEKMLALWMLTYHTFPGKCLTADYYYRNDPNYLSLQSSLEWLSSAEVPSVASIRYFDLEEPRVHDDPHHCDDNSRVGAPGGLGAGRFECMPLPEIVALLKYRNSGFCSVLIKELTGIEVASAPLECQSMKGPEWIGR